MIKYFTGTSSGSFEKNLTLMCKQVQKFMNKNKVKPVKLVTWKEESPRIMVLISFKKGEGDFLSWLNTQGDVIRGGLY